MKWHEVMRWHEVSYKSLNTAQDQFLSLRYVEVMKAKNGVGEILSRVKILSSFLL